MTRHDIFPALLFLIGCQSAAGQGSGLPPASPLDTRALRPLELRYEGAHRGDHQPWIYRVRMTIQRDTHAGQPAWRQTYRLEHISPPSDSPPRYESTTLLQAQSLAFLEGRDAFDGSSGDGSRLRLVSRGDHLVGESEEAGRMTSFRIEAPGFVVREFDLLLMALPLRVGYRATFSVLDDRQLRPFSLSVERRERVRVPAGEFDALHVIITPLDGSQRLARMYQVREKQPRIALRRQYVVNPETIGKVRRSVGTEELAWFREGR